MRVSRRSKFFGALAEERRDCKRRKLLKIAAGCTKICVWDGAFSAARALRMQATDIWRGIHGA